MNFVEELKWRGMIHDIMPGTEECLQKAMTVGYVGFDPTAPSLTVGNLVTVMLLVHFQRAGHKPIALVGGATGMIGDPSGKDEERKLLDTITLHQNQEAIKLQLARFLDFDCVENPAEIVNNLDFYKGMSIFDFLRDIGKHLTVSYLLGKGFIKDRKDDISFTEFNYILMQAYDFLWLLQHKNCTLQMGGSDQWGNITAGTELIRKKLRKKTFGLTCPLITKTDGSKFGKSEEGNIWLDPKMTSPYKFYQFWMNCSDDDAAKFIRIFTTRHTDEIENLEKEHLKTPDMRLLQKALAKDVTIRVHSEDDYNSAVDASEILFGKGTKNLTETALRSVFQEVVNIPIKKDELKNNDILDFLSATTRNMIFQSKGEARRMIQGGGVSINNEKINLGEKIDLEALLKYKKYLLVQKGKKNYFGIEVS